MAKTIGKISVEEFIISTDELLKRYGHMTELYWDSKLREKFNEAKTDDDKHEVRLELLRVHRVVLEYLHTKED